MAKVYGVYRINDTDEHVSIRKNPEQEYIRLYAANGEITDEEMALAHKIAAIDDAVAVLKLVDGCLQEYIEFLYCEQYSNDEEAELLVKVQGVIAQTEGES